MASSTSTEVATTNQSSGDQQQNQSFVCVKRPDASLTSVFREMYSSERLVDVTLCCSNGQLQAHKVVLAACSPYFCGLFDKLANPFHYPVVVIKDMQIEDLRLVVDFMYRGQITIDQDRLSSLVKCAENLQITGLSSLDALITTPIEKLDGNHTTVINVEGPKLAPPPANATNPKNYNKRAKRSTSSSINHQVIFSRTYQRNIHHHGSDDIMYQRPEKFLEQSMIVSNDNLLEGTNHAFNASAYAIAASNNHPTSAKNLIACNTNSSNNSHHTSNHLNSNSNQFHSTTVPSLEHIQHHLGIDNHHNGGSNTTGQHQVNAHNNNISNPLQVLSHSLAANRATSMSTALHVGGSITPNLINNGNQHHQQQSSVNQNSTSSSSSSGHHSSSAVVRSHRTHPCNICWKTFREKANLKRHLQVHSLDRVVYACPDCNKTFSWKDNYIRHTKTAHHINNVSTRQHGA